ncbi:MAG: hypothetical protein ACYDD1_12245 [Caulobacteraceae bacterium]
MNDQSSPLVPVFPPLLPLATSLCHVAMRAPHAWWSTARRRRFAFLALCTPGFLCIVGLPVHRSFWALLLGLMLLGLAWAFRSLTEPLFQPATGDGHAIV